MNLQNILSWVMYLSILTIGTLSMWWAQKLYKQGDKHYRQFIYLTLLVMVLPLALRSEYVGFDTAEYNRFYYVLLDNGMFQPGTHIEPLHRAFIYIAVAIGHQNIALFIPAFITIALTLAGIWYLRDQLNLGLVTFFYICFFYLQVFNVVRQCFAIALVFFALRYISERKPLMYLLFIVIAYFMHSSAAVAIILYPLGAENLSPRTRKLLCFLAVGSVLLVVSPILGKILRFVVQLDVFSVYKKHLNTKDGVVGYSWIIRSVFILAAIFLSDRFKTEKGVRNVSLFATSLSLPFLAVNYISAPIGRIGAYFSMFNIITFSSFEGRYTEKPYLPKLENVIMIAFALLTFLTSLYKNGLKLIPYTTFFT